MHLNHLKATVITVCFNAEKYIDGAIQSVLSQSYPNIEYIIIDGASTDQTVTIIERYKKRITKIVSGKDRGIYDAMNKGVRFATGDIIYFLNADDRFFDTNVVANIVKTFEEHKKASLVIGKVEPVHASASFLSNKRVYQGKWSSKLRLLIDGLCHQRVFAKIDLFRKLGFFDLKLRYAADFDWLLRAYNAKEKFVHTNFSVAFFDVRGFSSRDWQGAISDIVHAVYRNAGFFEFFMYFVYVSSRKIMRAIHILLQRQEKSES
ncbi:MAG: glycosyltransferase family 2 protein [Candidatus Ozemobacteraceae bacterium]